MFLALRAFEHSLYDSDDLIATAFEQFEVNAEVARLRTRHKAGVAKENAKQRLQDDRGEKQREQAENTARSVNKKPVPGSQPISTPVAAAAPKRSTAGNTALGPAFAAASATGTVPLSLFLEERARCEELEAQNEMMQESLQQAQGLKEALVQHYEEEIELQKMATTEAEAATGRLARQLEHERRKREKAESALGRSASGGGSGKKKVRNGGGSGLPYALPKEGDSDSDSDSESEEESDEEISGGGETFRKFKSPSGKAHFGVDHQNESDEEADEEISGGGETFRQFKSPSGRQHFGVDSPKSTKGKKKKKGR